MMKTMLAGLILLGLGTLAAVTLAQPPEGGPQGPPPGHDGGPRGFGPPPPPKVMVVLDADGDGEISAEEIKGAVEALNSLDENDDGKLSGDEIHPPRPPRGHDGPGPGARDRGPGGREFGPGDRGPRGRRGDDEEFTRGRRQRGPRQDGPRGDGPPPGDFGGPGGGGPPPRMPAHLREELDLSDEQVAQLDALHKETREKFEKILTEEQREKLKKMRLPGPPRD